MSISYIGFCETVSYNRKRRFHVVRPIADPIDVVLSRIRGGSNASLILTFNGKISDDETEGVTMVITSVMPVGA